MGKDTSAIAFLLLRGKAVALVERVSLFLDNVREPFEPLSLNRVEDIPYLAKSFDPIRAKGLSMHSA